MNIKDLQLRLNTIKRARDNLGTSLLFGFIYVQFKLHHYDVGSKFFLGAAYTWEAVFQTTQAVVAPGWNNGIVRAMGSIAVSGALGSEVVTIGCEASVLIFGQLCQKLAFRTIETFAGEAQTAKSP